MKKLIAMIMALTVVLCLCACSNGGENETTAPESTGSTQMTKPNKETESTKPEKKVSHTVKVVDENGEPIANAMVQLCLEACVPAVTNAEGVAQWYEMPDENYKVSFVVPPAGYDCGANEFYFDEGSNEMTITLKAAEAAA